MSEAGGLLTHHLFGEGKARVWLKASAYTTRILLGSNGADPWVSPADYLAYFTQAHSLLKPDVAVLEVGDLFASWHRRHSVEAAAPPKRRSPSGALRRLIEIDGARALLGEIIEATLSHLGASVPLVLSMPSPRAWVLGAAEQAGFDPDMIDLDAVEDGAMYVADLMRSVSTHKIGGLLLEELRVDPGYGASTVERYRSIVNLARHYRWGLGLRIPEGCSCAEAARSDIDVVIASSPGNAPEKAFGVDVSERFREGAVMPKLRRPSFYFVEIAATQRPEEVLERLAALRAQ